MREYGSFPYGNAATTNLVVVHSVSQGGDVKRRRAGMLSAAGPTTRTSTALIPVRISYNIIREVSRSLREHSGGVLRKESCR